MSYDELAHGHYLRALEIEDADRHAAQEAYEACLAGDCRHLEARINLGRLLHAAGLHERAEEIYRGTEEADSILFFNLAVLLEDQGRAVEAVRYYEEALIHDPGMADAHLNLSLLLEHIGEVRGAFRHLLAYRRIAQALQDSEAAGG